MEMFIRVVETGSFSKAAAEFNVTQPTVTKQVAATEARLAVRLLNRNTRGVSLTETGALYYERCKSIVRDAEAAENIVQLRQSQAQGLLRIGTSVAFGRRVVVPFALEFMAQHPQVRVDLSFEDSYSDLVAQGLDIALRMGKLADSSLGSRFLGMNPWLLVAAPRYLRKHGTPLQPADLAVHNAIVYSSVQGDDVWRLAPPGGPGRDPGARLRGVARRAGVGREPARRLGGP
jgi:DNA-binding transcriptional LysR family regulator